MPGQGASSVTSPQPKERERMGAGTAGEAASSPHLEEGRVCGVAEQRLRLGQWERGDILIRPWGQL